MYLIFRCLEYYQSMASDRASVRRNHRSVKRLRRRVENNYYGESSSDDSSYETESDYEASSPRGRNARKEEEIPGVKMIDQSLSRRIGTRHGPLVDVSRKIADSSRTHSRRATSRNIKNYSNTIDQLFNLRTSSRFDASQSKIPSNGSPLNTTVGLRKRSFSQFKDSTNDQIPNDESSPARKSHRILKNTDNFTTRRRSSSEILNEKIDPHYKDILVETVRKLRRKCDPYGFFSKPVDTQDDDCSDYYDIVSPSEAMCFNSIEEKIQSGVIRSLEEIKDHIDMIVHCAKKYNTDEENFVRLQANLMMSRAEPILDTAINKWNDRRKVSLLKQPKHVEKVGRKLKLDDESDFEVASEKKNRNTRKITDNSSKVRKRNRKITYTDMDSVGSEVMESIYDNKLKNKSSLEECGPIEGSEIPFAKPMLVGSIMTPCNTREEWKEICPKLAIVCNEAARRSTLRANPSALRYEKPLSETYIKERLDYDEPLDGFVIRTKDKSQYIQGFIVATCFKTWRKTFRFVFDEPEALITPLDHRLHMTDIDGSLTSELQICEVEEIDNGMGIRFPRICEISLLGGLACGGVLLSRTLSEIRQSGKYDYCVLQSTNIAIPFYEKHGFVRIGAVCKFNDMPGLSDVAYRHWSEIANGEAVEPSYMMARRLQTTKRDNDNNGGKVHTLISYSERLKDIRTSLQSSHHLLLKSLASRVGSLTYILTYRELLSSAREFALSADDFDLAKVIDNAINQFTGSHIGPSKAFVKQELRNGITIGNTIDLLTHDDQVSNIESHTENEEDVDQSKVVKVLISPAHYRISDGLTAIVHSHFLDVDEYFPITIRLANQVLREEHEQLTAKISRFLKSSKDVIEAGDLAVENLRSFIFSRGVVACFVEAGDVVMIRKDAPNGSFFWIEVAIKKKCKVNGIDSFVVEWEGRNGKIKREKRLLTNRNRGIGKDWCTELDWASFFALPTPILDAWLIGSSVVHTNTNGKAMEGVITSRQGGGMENDPTWCIEMGRSGKKKGRPQKGTSYSFECFRASFLRNIIRVSESNFSRVRVLLKDIYTKQSGSLPLDGSDRSTKKSEIFKPSKKMPTVEEWVQYRISKFNLANFHELSDEEKSKIRKSVHKVDDMIIHMRTGVQESYEPTDNLSDKLVPREKLKRKVKTVTNYMV